ncbi:taspase, threonine aspartase, 1, partial [Rhizoclosmatium hyalinum]
MPDCLGLTPLIAVHSGAGTYSTSRASTSKTHAVLKRALEAGIAALSNHNTSTDSVIAAITVLENDPCTNSGFGSNLTAIGTVECDAAVMHGGGAGAFGGVGAVSGVRNPVKVAARVMNAQIAGGVVGVLGRVRPMVVVGDGAVRGFGGVDEDKCHDSELVSEEALARWKRVLDLLEKERDGLLDGGAETGDEFEDTVGAVAVDCCGNIVAGVSSGGILFKTPGRVGEAALFGCGVWAQNVVDQRLHIHRPTALAKPEARGIQIGAGCSLTGTGEQIIRTLLSREVAITLLETSINSPESQTSIAKDILQVEKEIERVIVSKFLDAPILRGFDADRRNLGILSIRIVIEPSESSNEKDFVKREV